VHRKQLVLGVALCAFLKAYKWPAERIPPAAAIAKIHLVIDYMNHK